MGWEPWDGMGRDGTGWNGTGWDRWDGQLLLMLLQDGHL